MLRSKRVILAVFVTFCCTSRVVHGEAPRGRFVGMQPVPGLDSPYSDSGITVSDDGLVAYFSSPSRALVPGEDQADFELFLAVRDTVNDPFGERINLGPAFNELEANNSSPFLSPDQLTLYWSARPEPELRTDIYIAHRPTIDSAFGRRTLLWELNTVEHTEYSPSVSDDGLTIVFDRVFPAGDIGGERNIYIAERDSHTESFRQPTAVDALNSDAAEAHPALSPDGLTLFYAREVGQPNSTFDLWVATRPSRDEPFDNPMPIEQMFPGTVINEDHTATWEPFVAADWPANGSRIYFGRTTLAAPRDWDFYEATWQLFPTGDINSDAALDAADVDALRAFMDGDGPDYADINDDGNIDRDDVSVLVREILATEFGDANLDGHVNDLDLEIWNQSAFQSQTNWASADFNGDGVTDGQDFNIWNAHRGFVAEASQVAEPASSSVFLLLPGLWIVPRIRRMRSKNERFDGMPTTFSLIWSNSIPKRFPNLPSL